MNSLFRMEKVALASIMLVGLALAGCGKKNEDSATSSSPSDLSETANAASEQAIAVAQSLDSTSYALIQNKRKTSVAKKVQQLILPEALATTACNAGGSSVGSCPGSAPYTIERTYNSCSMANSAITVGGAVDYTYSNSGCSIVGVTNRSVTRTVSMTMSGKSGGTLTISSANITDYRGNTIGGGQTLSVNAVAGEYSYAVGGVTRVLTGPGGTILFSISTRTTTPFTASGTSLSNLVLSGGALEVIHNKAQYALTLSASNVAFSNSCACPVSGSMSGSYSGSVSGSATITYTGCGSANVTTSRGDSASVTIDSCAY